MALDTQGNPIPTVINTAVPAPTVQSVYSADNIQQAVTNPTVTPNLSDPYGLYDQFMNSAEIKAARNAVAQGQAQINATNQGLRTTTTALQQQNVGNTGRMLATTNLVSGQTARARELAANELAALGETQNANIAYYDTVRQNQASLLDIAKQDRSQLQSLIGQTGGKAGISYTDSYESALQKATDYTKKIAKEEKETAYKDSLKSTALQLGIKTKGKSTSEIEKALKKYYKSEKDYNKQIKALELSAKQKSLAGSSTEKINANAFYSTATNLKNAGKSWGEIANTLGKNYDLTPGSDYSQQLDSIMTGQVKQTASKAKTYDPVSGKLIQYDENGRPYIEE